MHLYVQGPAFNLPSNDPDCLAAIALLKFRLPTEAWTLTPAPEDSDGLPLLLDGPRRLTGFRHIVQHIQGFGKCDADLSGSPDATAIASFLEAHAQTLLDISLYVSFDNYTTVRSAFTQILPWHTNYILPPKRREAARIRTEHLGISSIDVDNVHEDLSGRASVFDGNKEQAFEVEAQKRASLLLPRRETVRSMLRRPEHSAIFKLHALADNFMGPLQDMLGEKSYLLGDDFADVDCQAYGYLSLMLYPKLPQDWLASVMRTKYRRLAEYVERIHHRLELNTNVTDVMSRSSSRKARETNLTDSQSLSLPWQPPSAPPLTDVFKTTASALLSQITLLYPSADIIRSGKHKRAWWQRFLPAISALTASSIGGTVYLAFRLGILVWPHGEPIQIFGKMRRSDYGPLGAALAGL